MEKEFYLATKQFKIIRQIRERLTQFALAMKSGVHPSRISLIERGLGYPTENERLKLSEALGVLPEKLFNKTRKPQIIDGE